MCRLQRAMCRLQRAECGLALQQSYKHQGGGLWLEGGRGGQVDLQLIDDCTKVCLCTVHMYAVYL